MKTIWKYELKVTDEQVISVPVGAQALAVQVQGVGLCGALCIWALVDSEAELRHRTVYIHGTGHEVSLGAQSGRHIGTVQLAGGALVFHVFVGAEF